MVHDKRNLILVLLLLLSGIWAFAAWFMLGPMVGAGAGIWVQRIIATVLVVAVGAWLFYALNFEDKLDDRLAETVGRIYFDSDGLSFMPTIRVGEDGQAELCLYYQNRYENYAFAVVHLRPPKDSFIVRSGMHDMHLAFRVDGGDFGVVRHPIAVPRHLQGEVINVEMAASVRYPRNHGTRLRSNEGLACGSLLVDWAQPFKAGVHEVSGELELKDPVTVHLSMPMGVKTEVTTEILWRQEQIESGELLIA